MKPRDNCMWGCSRVPSLRLNGDVLLSTMCVGCVRAVPRARHMCVCSILCPLRRCKPDATLIVLSAMKPAVSRGRRGRMHAVTPLDVNARFFRLLRVDMFLRVVIFGAMQCD
jgi:hypothetical protein